MSAQPQKWLVGLDLGPRSDGAIRYAAWLARTCGATLIGAHVMAEEYLRIALRYHHLGDLEAKAMDAARGLVSQASAADVISDIIVGRGKTIEEQLQQLREQHGCTGVIVGRNAPREGHHALRLGQVARRLLRSLQSPVIVVPPDWSEHDLGSGPILAGCSLDEDSELACAMARDLAVRTGRDLELVHIAPMPDHHSAQYLSDETLAAIRKEHLSEGEAALATWAKQHGYDDAATTVVLGTVSERLAALAAERQALAITVGSRRLSSFERWLLASCGTSLAAHAACPVLVAPPAVVRS